MRDCFNESHLLYSCSDQIAFFTQDRYKKTTTWSPMSIWTSILYYFIHIVSLHKSRITNSNVSTSMFQIPATLGRLSNDMLVAIQY